MEIEYPKIKRGTVREADGRMFWGCERRVGLRKGYTEIWLAPESFAKKKAKTARICKKWVEANRLENSEAFQRMKERSRLNMRKAWETRPKEMMVIRVKAKCKKLGLPFNLCADDFEMPEYCPLLGLKLERGAGKATMNSPELDRIIPSLGYVKGNVWVISRRANLIKSDATIEEIRMLAKNWPF